MPWPARKATLSPMTLVDIPRELRRGTEPTGDFSKLRVVACEAGYSAMPGIQTVGSGWQGGWTGRRGNSASLPRQAKKVWHCALYDLQHPTDTVPTRQACARGEGWGPLCVTGIKIQSRSCGGSRGRRSAVGTKEQKAWVKCFRSQGSINRLFWLPV